MVDKIDFRFLPLVGLEPLVKGRDAHSKGLGQVVVSPSLLVEKWP